MLQTELDFCAAEGVSCPILPGSNAKFTFSIVIPPSTPQVKVNVEAHGINADGTEVACAKISGIKIGGN